MKTKIRKSLADGWAKLQRTGSLKCRPQSSIYLDIRIEQSSRGGTLHKAVLINAHVDMRGRRYLLPTQSPLSSATPGECELLILEMINRLKKVAKPYKKEDEFKVEDFV